MLSTLRLAPGHVDLMVVAGIEDGSALRLQDPLFLWATWENSLGVELELKVEGFGFWKFLNAMGKSEQGTLNTTADDDI